MGTAPLAAGSLRALAAAPGNNVRAVVTQPDKPSGRDLKIQFSAVKEAALELGLPVLQPTRAREESFIQQLRAMAPDLIVVAAYGQILPQALLDIPRHGCLNVHASLLPKYRGAGPIQWAILDGEAETGVTIMKMDAGLDTGPMVTKKVVPIRSNDTAGILHDKLAFVGAQLLIETIPGYIRGEIIPEPQPAEGATYARKITKEDGVIDWSAPARQINNQVRGLDPWPSAYTHLESTTGTPALIKIWKAEVAPDHSGEPGTVLAATPENLIVACGSQALRILELQREGRRRLPAGDFIAGFPLPPGTRFSRSSRSSS